jgi:hypothetical protein
MSLIELPVLDSKSGNKTFSSSIPEIQLKYLLKRSHFSLSSYIIVLKSKTESSILRYKQQRNKVNNLKRNAKENFEKNLDKIILENAYILWLIISGPFLQLNS